MIRSCFTQNSHTLNLRAVGKHGSLAEKFMHAVIHMGSFDFFRFNPFLFSGKHVQVDCGLLLEQGAGIDQM
jgi:hypothetical protein